LACLAGGPDSHRDDFFFVILSDYLFTSGQKENGSKTILLSGFNFYSEITTNFFFLNILSFACAKESNKEKHTGNDLQPLPSR